MQTYHKWRGLRLEIAEYMTKHNIPENTFRFLGIYEWQNVYDKVVEHFVDKQYARNHGLHWSNIENGFQKNIDRIYSFQVGAKNYSSYEWLKKLPEIVKDEKVYLILEDAELPKYWVAECSPSVIEFIINDTYSVEDYYITDKKFNWLITGNHHDIVQFIGKGLDLGAIKSIATTQALFQ